MMVLLSRVKPSGYDKTNQRIDSLCQGVSITMKRIAFYALLIAGAICLAVPVMAADQSDLAGRAATYEKEYNANNLSGVAALYAKDGCRMPPNEETIHGTEAIIAQLKNGKTQGGAKIKIAVTSAETMGDMAYGSGTFEIIGADGTQMDKGKWMNVSKKIAGSWKIQCDIWNSSMPMPQTSMNK
jgi:ketosteroid isomerase-like protein